MKVINESARIEKVAIGKHEVLIVDDILSDPLGMRKFAFETYERAKNKKAKYRIGERIERKIDTEIIEIYPDFLKLNKKFPKLTQQLANVIKHHLEDEITAHFQLEKTDAPLKLKKGPYFNCVYKAPQFLPHVDVTHISSFIYLNSPTQCWGGTGIYTHLPTGMLYTDQRTTSLEWLAQKPLDKPLTESTDEWRLEYMVKMKFNRMVAFNGSFIHKIFWPEEGCPFKKGIKQSRLAINNFFWYR